jgi:hypothetical protein
MEAEDEDVKNAVLRAMRRASAHQAAPSAEPLSTAHESLQPHAQWERHGTSLPIQSRL